MKNKIKVSVITLHSVKNYGSVLQTLATQEKFNLYNCDTEIINYIREFSLDKNLLKAWTSKDKFPISWVKSIVMYPTIQRWKKVFNGFLGEYINLTSNIYTHMEDFYKYPIEADLYCTGSDQVWNSGWNSGILKELFLSFAPKGKRKLAYSASFGKTKLDNWEIPETKELLKDYEHISVRESSAVNILNDLGIPNATHVLDPTLAVSKNFWDRYIKRRVIKEDYVLIYQLNSNKEFDKYAKKFAKIKGLKLVRLCTRYDQIVKTGHSILVPEVCDFLSLFKYANYVITDSFHGTAFSLNFNREIVCIYPKEFSGRLDSILKLTNLTERHLTDYDDFSIADKPIDFEKVNEIFDEERKKVDAFLKEALSYNKEV